LNRAQQDVLLPFAESGDFSIIGATTENPGYEINSALLSRSQILGFERRSREDFNKVIKRASEMWDFDLTEVLPGDTLQLIYKWADGDTRQLLNTVDQLITLFSREQLTELTTDQLQETIPKPNLKYDKSHDHHYDLLSAMIKSIRGTDPDAAIYYFCRMLNGGEDPKALARRLIICASEDVGNADPAALPLAVSGFEALEKVGLPEAAINLSQVVTYLASAPKSNRSYMALRKAQSTVSKSGTLSVPKHLKSAQTSFSKQQGHGADYLYSHDSETGYVAQTFLPDELKGCRFYEPKEVGHEASIKTFLEELDPLKFSAKKE